MALVGAVLFALGLAGVADPPLDDGSMDPIDRGPSPLVAIGLLLLVFGGLVAYTAHLISRDNS